MPISLKVFKHVSGATQFSGEHLLEQDRVTIGRSKECTLSLEDPQRLLSRVHAELVRMDAGYRLEVASKNYPVTVNGRPYPPGSSVMVGAGDTFVMDVYEIEITDVSDFDPEATVVSSRPAVRRQQPASPVVHAPATPARELPAVQARAIQAAPVAAPAAAPVAVPAASAPALQAPAEVAVVGAMPAKGRSRAKMFALGAAAIVAAVASFFLWPMLSAGIFDRESDKKADQEIARLDAEAKSLLKLVERDRQEMKDAVAAANRESEEIKAQLAAARTPQEREPLAAAQLEAIETARLNAKLERALRDATEGPTGLPKAEGNLSAAAVAVRNGDRAGALKLLGETVAMLTSINTTFIADRKTLLVEQQRRKEALQAADAQSKAQAEARILAEREARAKADAASRARQSAENAAREKREAEAQAKAAAEAQARADAEAKSRAEIEARAKADAEVRAKVEVERLRLEAEARTRAQEEQRARAAALQREQEAARARAEAAARAREAAAERQRAQAEERERAEAQRQTVESIINMFGRMAR